MRHELFLCGRAEPSAYVQETTADRSVRVFSERRAAILRRLIFFSFSPGNFINVTNL